MNASTYIPESIRPAQLGYLNALLDEATALLSRREEVTGCEWPEAHAHVARIRSNVDSLTKREASAAISDAIKNNELLRDELKSLGALEEPVRRPAREFVSEPGIYQVDGRIFKVLPSRSSNRHYAKELTDFHWEDGKPVADEGAGAHLKFVIAKGAMAFIRKEHRLSPEAERAFGKVIGYCVNCGKLLTKRESIDYGKGPVCSDNYTR